MDNESVVGFWSYAHEDDMLDGGGIIELARLLEEEYSLLSGKPLDLFIDRTSIQWGQEWRQRIDSSLAQTTFFIPIITPRYFRRPECCRELLEFAAKAKSLSIEELLLPIIYIETRDLSGESSDEAVALVAKTQYVEWQFTRLLEPRSREFRAAVNALARRLLEIGESVAELQFNHEFNADPEDDGTDGIIDVVSKITALLPEWLEAVEDEKVNSAQVTATFDQFRQQINRLERARTQPSAILAVRQRMAKETLPLAERTLKDSRIYLAKSVELDPLISALARLVNEHPGSFSLVTQIREAIDEAMTEIRKNTTRKSDGYVSGHEVFSKMVHLGRIFQKCASIYEVSNRAGLEANGIVERWDVELRDISSE
jgi:hypothetical protein